MENLREYANRLDRALAKGKPHSTYNHDIFHAFAIVMAVFKHAKEKVFLLSNKLDLAVFGNPDILGAMVGFLDGRKGDLQILVESDIDKEHPVFQLTAVKSRKISIHQVPKEEVANYTYNFLVMDDKGFRFEKDREEHVAFAGFNDKRAKRAATALFARFDELQKKSPKLSLQL